MLRGDAESDRDVGERQVERLRAELEEVSLERNRLRLLLGHVLGQFYEKGHPGAPCIRTGWVNVKTYQEWVREAGGGEAGDV